MNLNGELITKVACDCQCGGEAKVSEMKIIPVEKQEGNRTRIVKRFWVLRECEQPFTEELILTHKLREIIESAAGKPWWQRIWHARRIYDLQRAINGRRFPAKARQIAWRSASQFGVPKWVGKKLARVWAWQDRGDGE